MNKSSFTNLFEKLITSPCTNDFILRGYLSPYDYVVIGKFSADQQTVNQLKARGSDGDYAICAIGKPLYLRYGILDRRGNIILPMEYESVYLIGGHRASVTKVHGFSRDIEL